MEATSAVPNLSTMATMSMAEQPAPAVLDVKAEAQAAILEGQEHIRSLLASQSVLIALAVVLATFVFLVVRRLVGGGKSASAIVLVGPSGAGKTTLFHQLHDASTHLGTVASMQENEGVCELGGDKAARRTGRQVRVVDVPGHPRLRHKLEQHLREARGIVFVIDAADITPHKVEAAEELYEVLTHASVASRRVPVLLACNKMDLETTAHSVEFIRRTLEKQLDVMRKTRHALLHEGGGATGKSALGRPDKPFSLSSLRSPIATVSISAEKGDLAELHQLLHKLL